MGNSTGKSLSDQLLKSPRVEADFLRHHWELNPKNNVTNKLQILVKLPYNIPLPICKLIINMIDESFYQSYCLLSWSFKSKVIETNNKNDSNSNKKNTTNINNNYNDKTTDTECNQESSSVSISTVNYFDDFIDYSKIFNNMNHNSWHNTIGINCYHLGGWTFLTKRNFKWLEYGSGYGADWGSMQELDGYDTILHWYKDEFNTIYNSKSTNIFDTNKKNEYFRLKKAKNKSKFDYKKTIDKGLMIVDLFTQAFGFYGGKSSTDDNGNLIVKYECDGKYGYNETGSVAILCIEYGIKESFNECIQFVKKFENTFSKTFVVVTNCKATYDFTCDNTNNSKKDNKNEEITIDSIVGHANKKSDDTSEEKSKDDEMEIDDRIVECFSWNDVVEKIGKKYNVSCFECGFPCDDNTTFVFNQIIIEYLVQEAIDKKLI